MATMGRDVGDEGHAACADRPVRAGQRAHAQPPRPAFAQPGGHGVAAHAELGLRDALLSFVSGRLRDRDEGEDIVQETYLRFYNYRRARPVGDIAGFCFTVARNLVVDHLRRLRVRRAMVEVDDSIACPRPRVEEMLDYRARVDILARALKAMPPLRREVFLRRRLDGLPVAVIAADLDLSPAAIEKHCSRALADLRHALERRGLALRGPA